MKALSIKGEWAILIRDLKKPIETRVWKTNYRGKLLLCASKLPKTELSGKAFAIVDLVDIKPMTKEHEERACCEVYPKANSWFLENIIPIKPFPVRGQLRLFEVNYEMGK